MARKNTTTPKEKTPPVSRETAQTKEKKERGCILVALGHPMYTHYAHLMAVGLKLAGEDNVCLLTDGGGLDMLSEDQKKMFSEIKYIPFDMYSDNGVVNYFKAKLHLDKLTPYKKTLYLDVDQAWNQRRTVQDLYSIYDGCSFQPIILGSFSTTEREIKAGDWMNYADLKTYYEIESVYDLSSEVLYFEETNIFELARKVYDENKFEVKKFGGGKPDEPYFIAALALSGIKPKYTDFIPSYWQNRFFTKMLKDEDVYNNFFLISAGGNRNAINTERMFNAINGANFNKIGLATMPYKLQHKNRVLKKERQEL